MALHNVYYLLDLFREKAVSQSLPQEISVQSLHYGSWKHYSTAGESKDVLAMGSIERAADTPKHC